MCTWCYVLNKFIVSLHRCFLWPLKTRLARCAHKKIHLFLDQLLLLCLNAEGNMTFEQNACIYETRGFEMKAYMYWIYENQGFCFM